MCWPQPQHQTRKKSELNQKKNVRFFSLILHHHDADLIFMSSNLMRAQAELRFEHIAALHWLAQRTNRRCGNGGIMDTRIADGQAFPSIFADLHDFDKMNMITFHTIKYSSLQC